MSFSHSQAQDPLWRGLLISSVQIDTVRARVVSSDHAESAYRQCLGTASQVPIRDHVSGIWVKGRILPWLQKLGPDPELTQALRPSEFRV